jgi:hypothetical protein
MLGCSVLLSAGSCQAELERPNSAFELCTALLSSSRCHGTLELLSGLLIWQRAKAAAATAPAGREAAAAAAANMARDDRCAASPLPDASCTQSLVSGDEFQHILRVLNTNVDGKQKVMYAMTAIRGLGRRFSNLVCKKAEVDMKKR